MKKRKKLRILGNEGKPRERCKLRIMVEGEGRRKLGNGSR